MEVLVKSLQGSYLVSGLEQHTTVGELKRMLHQQHASADVPEETCLVHQHSVLASPDAALQQLGITHGDQLVLLPVRPPVKRPRAQTTPAADTAAIRAAITDEARSRGIEHTLKEERPPGTRRGTRPADLLGASNEQLLQLLQQAFDGHLPGGLQLNVSAGGAAGGAAAEAEQEEPEGEVQVPEPPADRIAQLTDMGFGQGLARNALLLQRGNVEAALEWLLEHADDPAAADPIPEERLRQIYGRRRSRPAGNRPLAALRPEVLLSQLTDMGFDGPAAEAVLSRVGPSLELAVQMLLGGGSAGGAAPQAAAAAGGAAAAAGAAAGSAPASAPQDTDAAGASSSSSGEQAGSPPGAAAAEAGASAGTDDDASAEEEDGFEDGDEEEFEDEDEDDFFDDEDALYDLPIAGTVQLANLGSADIDQLLQGANLQELTMGNQLLMPGAMDTTMAGPQATLLRLLDSPAFLEQVAAGMQALQEGGEQQQEQQPPEPPQQGGEGSSS